MQIFRDQFPFQKVLVQRDLFRYRNREIGALCYEELAMHFLTDRQKSSYGKQRGPELREAYIRKRAEEGFVSGRPDETSSSKPKPLSPGYIPEWLVNPLWKPREISESKPHTCDLAECTPERMKSLADMLLDESWYSDERPRVLLVVTGGTGFCKTEDDGLSPTLPVDVVLDRIPLARERYEIIVEDFSGNRFDSSQAQPKEQLMVAQAIASGIEKHKPAGVVVAHGTDTMAETAHALSLGARWPVPVVMTGAMKAGELEDSDIAPNLRYSFFYSTLAPLRRATFVCYGGELHEGTLVIHDSTAEKKALAFESKWEKERGSSGKVYNHKDMVKRKLKAQTPLEPSDFKSATNLGLSPRVLDPRLGIRDDYQRWSEVYADLSAATERVRSREISLRPDYLKPSRVKILSEAPPVKIITLHSRDEALDAQIGGYIEGLNLDDGHETDPPVLLRNRKGIFVRGFSGLVRNKSRRNEVDTILRLAEMGIPTIVGSRVGRDVSAGPSAYAPIEALRGETTIIYPYGMTDFMATTKLSMIMSELQQIIEDGRRDLETPKKYLTVINRAMRTDVDGEVNGHPGEKTIGEVVEEIAAEISDAQATA